MSGEYEDLEAHIEAERDRDHHERRDIEDALDEVHYQARLPASEGQAYALAMAIEAARLAGATETEIQSAAFIGDDKS